jgi:hypothetical protein
MVQEDGAISENGVEALKHTPTSGPNWRISAFKCTRRWSLILEVIFDGSFIANRSRTFAAVTSTSDCKHQVNINNNMVLKTYKIFLHIADFRYP